MQVLDNFGAKPKGQKGGGHKLLYYYIYSMGLFLAVPGLLGLVSMGILDDDTVFNTSWGFVWLGLLFVLLVVFYNKVMQGLLMAIGGAMLAFFISFWVTGFFVDSLLHISRDEPIYAGLVAYLCHWVTTVLIPALHYVGTEKLE
ncbi:MAG: hypothetical protein GY810_13320 [Aureispira sp.]|nr:hypothetical protein [Aureispira sp.]